LDLDLIWFEVFDYPFILFFSGFVFMRIVMMVMMILGLLMMKMMICEIWVRWSFLLIFLFSVFFIFLKKMSLFCAADQSFSPLGTVQ
jgi:hypothetical protein